MNSLTFDLLVSALGSSLLNFLWQGAVVGLVTALLLRYLGEASPRSRYAISTFSLFVCLFIPLIRFAWVLVQADQLGSAPLPNLQTPGLEAWYIELHSRMPVLLVAWLLGIGFMNLRLIFGMLWVNHLCRNAVLAPVEWQQRIDLLARRLGLRRQVALKLLPTLSCPITLGFWRPVVLLPAALLSGMPLPMLEALIAHELAHIRRWDYFVNLLQNIVESLLFFHPVIWWLSRQIRVERELVADDIAAQNVADSRSLAMALSALSLQVRSFPQSALTISARGGVLSRRIERLIAPPLKTANWKVALPLALLSCASIFLMQGRGPLEISPSALRGPSQLNIFSKNDTRPATRDSAQAASSIAPRTGVAVLEATARYPKIALATINQRRPTHSTARGHQTLKRDRLNDNGQNSSLPKATFYIAADSGLGLSIRSCQQNITIVLLDTKEVTRKSVENSELSGISVAQLQKLEG